MPQQRVRSLSKAGRTHDGLKSFERSLDVLNLLANRSAKIGIADLCAALTLPRSTAYRFLSALVRRGYLEGATESGCYQPGPRLYQLSATVLGSLELRSAAIGPMTELCTETSESVFLLALVDMEALCIEKVEGSEGLQLVLKVGARRPLHCSGIARVLAAYLPDRDLEKFLVRPLKRYTPYSIIDPAKLRRELAETRRRGYSISTNEFVLGARSLGAPIRDLSGHVIAALGIGCLADRLPDSRVPELAKLLTAKVNEISQRLGYTGQVATREGASQGRR